MITENKISPVIRIKLLIIEFIILLNYIFDTNRANN
jgi:hypothetical protein